MNTYLSSLSQAELIERCSKLEQQLAAQTAKITELTKRANGRTPSSVPKKPMKDFDASRHSTRFIALKFSYLGHRYNGFEHANRCFTPLPTIEEVLWKALRKARLISPPVPEGADASFEVIHDTRERERKYHIYGRSRHGDTQNKQHLDVNWEGCQYSKCGRTDRGVSAFGQVIGIRVRSNAPVEKQKVEAELENDGHMEENMEDDEVDEVELDGEERAFNPIEDELPYVYMLNMILPHDIRILAWCPHPPEGFDARYSCLERRYKYFFTNPAFCPTPGRIGLTHASGQAAPVREGWLDIDRMREAAKKLEGTHDYRNLCQIDASKQMPSCQRRINFADVEEFDGVPTAMSTHPALNAHGEVVPKLASANHLDEVAGPKVYAIVVHGSAFLWHQVRCIAAVLFLVGQGLENPDIVDKLLDITQNPGRPHYAMADDAPLVLWDCVFPSEQEGDNAGLDWIYAGDQASIPGLTAKGDGKFGLGGVVDELWSQWHEAKLKEAQIGGLLSLAMAQGDNSSLQRGGFRDPHSVKGRSQKVYEGASKARLAGQYQPFMERRAMDSLEVLNTKYMASVKGVRRLAKRSEAEGQDAGD
ncbi:pseudouridine synthase deg1 [Lithohypha guttulata]|uniref:pseudouridine synthase deg1 n=1 Tax=Lithohypha guttulata TaxID=1690604 RepID=UPI002DE1963A|nr:pseudouridine synthase deg1 [Lithohypha guttulata]